MFNNVNTPVDTDAATEAAQSVTDAVTEATEALSFSIEPMNFVENLPYLLSGMLGIFAVIGVIALTTVLINKFFAE